MDLSGSLKGQSRRRGGMLAALWHCHPAQEVSQPVGRGHREQLSASVRQVRAFPAVGRQRQAQSWGFCPGSCIKHSRMAEGWEGRTWAGMHRGLEEEICVNEMKTERWSRAEVSPWFAAA